MYFEEMGMYFGVAVRFADTAKFRSEASRPADAGQLSTTLGDRPLAVTGLLGEADRLGFVDRIGDLGDLGDG